MLLLVGTLLGFLSGLGIGGGSLLILYLTVVLGTPPAVARGINLLFFLPSAVIACLIRMRKGQLQLKPLLGAIIAGCAAAALFSYIGARMDSELLKKLFGVVLLAAGARELLYKNKKL